MTQQLNIDWLVSDKIGILNGTNPVESPEVLTELEREGYLQVVTVRPWPVTMAWRLPGCNLRNFMVRATASSGLSQRDLSRLNEFCLYELTYRRRVLIWFEDTCVRDTVTASISRFFSAGSLDFEKFLVQAMITKRDRYLQLPVESPVASGCHYCHDGLCFSDLVCHTTAVQSAISIVRGGSILSACRAFGLSAEEIARDPRNAAGDPPDYFEYVMFGPGNCTAVDKLVLERAIGYVPSWEEFEAAFQPGVRFYFRFSDLCNHPGFTLDGVHKKIHRELTLDPWLVLMVVPEGLDGSDELLEAARQQLPAGKLVSLPFERLHYKDWARIVYREAKTKG